MMSLAPGCVPRPVRIAAETQVAAVQAFRARRRFRFVDAGEACARRFDPVPVDVHALRKDQAPLREDGGLRNSVLREIAEYADLQSGASPT